MVYSWIKEVCLISVGAVSVREQSLTTNIWGEEIYCGHFQHPHGPEKDLTIPLSLTLGDGKALLISRGSKAMGPLTTHNHTGLHTLRAFSTFHSLLLLKISL